MLYQHANALKAAGFSDETIATSIASCGVLLPVYGNQLRGVYIRADGHRDPHYAVPGWYRIESMDKSTLRIRKAFLVADMFECPTGDLKAVLGANLECLANGMNPGK